MKIGQARQAAIRWMTEQASQGPDFCGAYLAGSTNWLDDNDSLPIGSDVDVMVISATCPLPARRKIVFDDVLLEVSHLDAERFRDPETLLSDYHLAPSFATTQALLDPYRWLGPIREAVVRDYSQKHTIRRRCADAREAVLRHLRSINSSDELHDQAMAVLFAAGVTAHILLVAGLRNPTVRDRYIALRGFLADVGLAKYQETMLQLVGAQNLPAAQVPLYVRELGALFDKAAGVSNSLPFATDIAESGRPAVVDYALNQSARGLHREAMFWVAVTHCRCQKILAGRLSSVTHALLDDMGIGTPAGIAIRAEEIKAILPQLEEVADAITERVTSSEDASSNPSRQPRH